MGHRWSLEQIACEILRYSDNRLVHHDPVDGEASKAVANFKSELSKMRRLERVPDDIKNVINDGALLGSKNPKGFTRDQLEIILPHLSKPADKNLTKILVFPGDEPSGPLQGSLLDMLEQGPEIKPGPKQKSPQGKLTKTEKKKTEFDCRQAMLNFLADGEWHSWFKRDTPERRTFDTKSRRSEIKPACEKLIAKGLIEQRLCKKGNGMEYRLRSSVSESTKEPIEAAAEVVRPPVIAPNEVITDVIEPPEAAPVEATADVTTELNCKQAVVPEVVPAPTRQAIALPTEKRIEVVQHDSSLELVDLLRQGCKEPEVLNAWIAFCDRFPGLKWFVVDGVVLFPIPLVEQLKAENPGILSEDVYIYDYSRHFAEKHLRVPLGSSLLGKTSGILLWVKAISERPGTKEAYQLKGYEDDPDAVGFIFEGGPHPRHYGKASYEAHQQIGAAMGKIGIFHAVTFPVLYAYLVQGRSSISRGAQRLGSTAITYGVKQGIEAKRENTPIIELANGSAFDPRISQVIQALHTQTQYIESQFNQLMQHVNSHGQTLNTIISGIEDLKESLGSTLYNTLQQLLDMTAESISQKEEWLAKASNIEAGLAHIVKIDSNAEETMNKVIRHLEKKRNNFTKDVQQNHIEFLWECQRYQGRCPISGVQIVDFVDGKAAILENSGKKLGEFDHNFAVNQAEEMTSWLILAEENARLNNDGAYRFEVQVYYAPYQKDLRRWRNEKDGIQLSI